MHQKTSLFQHQPTEVIKESLTDIIEIKQSLLGTKRPMAQSLTEAQLSNMFWDLQDVHYSVLIKHNYWEFGCQNVLSWPSSGGDISNNETWTRAQSFVSMCGNVPNTQISKQTDQQHTRWAKRRNKPCRELYRQRNELADNAKASSEGLQNSNYAPTNNILNYRQW